MMGLSQAFGGVTTGKGETSVPQRLAGSGLSQLFGDTADTNEGKNARIGEILRIGDVYATRDRLRLLANAVELTLDYKSYIQSTIVQGVENYLREYVEKTGDTALRSFVPDTQALHDSIMEQAFDVNIPAMLEGQKAGKAVPEKATVVTYADSGSSWLGYHTTTKFAYHMQFEIGVNMAQTAEEIINTVGHETAHHIEKKLACLDIFNSGAVPSCFKTDAAYFRSLDEQGAYIQSGLDHEVYKEQANERMANEAGHAAVAAFKNFKLSR